MKTIQEIIYCSIDEIKEGNVDIAITIDGNDLIDKDTNEALKILKNNNMINNGNVVIPAGLEVTKKQCVGAEEYNFGNGHIIVDLAFDDGEEKQYIR